MTEQHITLTNVQKLREINKYINLYDGYLISECGDFDDRLKIIEEVGRLLILRESISKLPIKHFSDTFIEYSVKAPSKLNTLKLQF